MALTGWIRESSQVGGQLQTRRAPPRVTTLYVSANYFQTFGVSLARGPGFDPAIDDATSAEPRVVVSDDFWRSRMAADPDIVGKSVTLDGVPHTVVGIAPEDFRGALPLLSSAELDAVHSPGAAPASEGESESSRRQDRRLGADPRPARRRREHHAGECAGVGDGRRSGAAVSRVERIQGGDGRTVHVDGRGRSSGVATRDRASC